MIKVSDLKKLGVKVTAGDFAFSSEFGVSDPLDVDACITVNKTTANDELFITAFAWRENTGKEPEFGGNVFFKLENGQRSTEAISADRLRWCNASDGMDITVWKPCMKSLLAQVASDKPESIKTATEYLNDCIEVQKQRGEQYDSSGTGERSFASAAKAFTALTGKELSGSDVCLILTCVKAVRQYSNPERLHEDSLLDGVSYLSLWAEELNKELIK